MIDSKSIGNRIREHRKRMGKSQEDLAEYIGVDPTFVSRVERGKARFNLERLSSVSAFLKVPLEYLVCGVTMDSSDYLLPEFSELLKDMNYQEKKFILDVVKSMKNNFRKND